MPVVLTRADRRLLIMGGVVFVGLIGVAALLSSSSVDGREHPSSYSTGSSGAKAAFLLLQALGYQVERWQDPLEQLTDAGGVTLVLAEPIETPAPTTRQALRRFLERGGRVIATGMSGAVYLGESAVPDPVSGLTWERVPAVAPSPIARAAPAITLAPRAAWPLHSPALVLYRDDGAPRVVRMPAGEGEAIWWASATPLTNAGLREAGNLEFFLACLGPPEGQRVLWDEYTHGHRRTLAGSIANSPVKWIALQAGVVVLALLWTHARRSGPILPAPVESRLSPLEFVRTLGSLYHRANAAGVAVDIAHERVRTALARRLGIAPSASADEVERTLASRGRPEATSVGEALRASDEARHRENVPPARALALVQQLGHVWSGAAGPGSAGPEGPASVRAGRKDR